MENLLSPKKISRISKLVQQIRDMSSRIEEYQVLGNEELVKQYRSKRGDFIRKLSASLDFR